MTTKSKQNGTKADATDATVLDLSMDDLSLGDCIDVEDVTGQPAFAIFAAAQTGSMSAKAMAALVWVSRRRSDPTFTFDDAKAVKVAALGGEDAAQG